MINYRISHYEDVNVMMSADIGGLVTINVFYLTLIFFLEEDSCSDVFNGYSMSPLTFCLTSVKFIFLRFVHCPYVKLTASYLSLNLVDSFN